MGILSKLFKPLFSWLVPDASTSSQASGTELSTPNTDAYVPVIYGKVGKVPGTIIFRGTNDYDGDDTENDLLHIVIVWCHGTVESIDQIYIDDVPITDSYFDGQDGARWAHARNFTNGLVNYNDPRLEAAGWSYSTDKLTNFACSYLRLEWSNKNPKFQGEPKITADITGRRILNLATSTYEASSNPVDQLYDYLVACRVGKNLPTSKVDLASFTAARAQSVQQIETVTGSGEYQDLYTSNISLDTGESVLDNVNKLTLGMRAALPEYDGKISLKLELDDSPVSEDLLEDDIIEISEVTNSNKANRYNRVIVKYKEPSANWTAQEAIYPPKDSAEETAWLAEDNGIVLETSVDLDGCTDYYEALRHAKAVARVSREQLKFEAICNPIASQYEVGDIVPVSHSVLGWDAKPFRVDNIEHDEDGEVTIAFREHQPYIYDWNNTGLKPSYSDTNLTLANPSVPTNLTVADVYNSQTQVTVSWASDATRFVYYLRNASNELIQSGEVGRNSVSFNNLELGDYRIYIRALASFNRQSGLASEVFEIAVPQTPENPVVEITNGSTTITPVKEVAVHTFGWKYSTTDDFNNATATGNQDSLTIQTEHGTTYFFWYWLVTSFGESNVVSGSFVGQGIVEEQLNPALTGVIERAAEGGALDNAIEAVNSDLITSNENTQLEIGRSVLDNLANSLRQGANYTELAEELASVNGILVELNEELGKVTVQGGQITATEIAAIQVTLDAFNAEITALATKQTEIDGTVTSQTSELQVLSDSVTLLQTTIGGLDFDALVLRMDAAENSITQSAISIEGNLLDNLATGFRIGAQNLEALTQAQKLALAESQIQAITDEQGAQAEKIDTVATVANDGYALAQDAQTSISNESEQRASAITILRAEKDEDVAQLREVQEVLVDSEGNTRAIYTAILDVNGRITGFELLNDGTTTNADFIADNFRVLAVDGNIVLALNTETERMELNADLILGDGFTVTSQADIQALETVVSRLTNNNHTITTDYQGAFDNAELSTAGGTFELRKGETLIDAAEITFSIAQLNGAAASIDENGVYTITGLSADLSTIVFRATYNTVYFYETYTISKNKQGAPGVDAPRPVYMFIRSVTQPATPGTAAVGWFSDIPEGTEPVWFIFGYRDSNNQLIGAWTDPVRHTGEQGETPTVTDNGDGSYTISGSNGDITIFDGANGQNGANAPIPTVTDNGNGTYTINNNAGQSVTFSDGEDGQTPTKGIDYFDGTDGSFRTIIFKVVTNGSTPAAPTGGSFDGTDEVIPSGWTDKSQYAGTGVEFSSVARYNHNGSSWSRSPDWSTPSIYAQTGAQGVQGVQGEPGANGTTTYTWIKYADNASGSGLSDNPTGKTYIGFAYNKTTQTESTNAADYNWSLIQGADGVPGENGANGITYYTWIKYSANSDGSGLTNSPQSNTQYIGIAHNKTTATESTNPSDYTWALFKGADGADGTDGQDGAPGSDGAPGQDGANGIDGDRGAGTYAVGTSTGAWSDATANAAVPNGAPVNGDVVTIWQTSNPTNQTTKIYTGSAWVAFTMHIHGDALIDGTVVADSVRATISISAPAITGGTIDGTVVTGGRMITPEINTLSNGSSDTSKAWSILSDGSYVNRWGGYRFIIGERAGASGSCAVWYGGNVSQSLRTAENATFALTVDGKLYAKDVYLEGQGKFDNGLSVSFNGAYIEAGRGMSSGVGTVDRAALGYSGSSDSGVIADTQGVRMFSTNTAYSYPVRLDGDSRVIGDLDVTGGLTSLTAGHTALMLIDFVAEIGDCIITDGFYVTGMQQNIPFGKLSQTATDKGFWGVYTGKVNTFTEYDIYHLHTLQSIGEGQIQVCGQNGDIAVDDLLVLSDIPGKCMKQADDILRANTIAQALEPVTFESSTQTKLISVKYRGG